MKAANYSIVSFLNSPVTGERIAIGLIILLPDGKVITGFSSKKMEFAKRLNPSNYSFFEKKIQSYFNGLDRLNIEPSGARFNLDYLNYLSIYEQGSIHFSEPKLILEEITETKFEKFFNLWIQEDFRLNPEHIEPNKEVEKFKQGIEIKIRQPLRHKIDVDYKVKSASVPQLIFDFKVDAIGANGSLFSAKSVDLISTTHQSAQNTIARFEFMLSCLIPFVESKFHLSGSHRNVLILNEPPENNPNFELYRKLLDKNALPFEVTSVSRASDFTTDVLHKKAKPLSELLEGYN